MTTQTQTILDAARALPETERLLLVERLLAELPLETDELTEEELYAELQQRRAEVQLGAGRRSLVQHQTRDVIAIYCGFSIIASTHSRTRSGSMS